MIRQLEWMNGDGVFEGFRWGSAVPDFACINVIYGHNGAGKTSLAKALDAARTQAGGCERLSLRVDEQGATRSTNGKADPVYERLLVFCESYVERSHRFHEGNPNIDAVLTLGERETDVEDRITTLNEERVGGLAERARSGRDGAAAAREVARVLERVSTAVVGDLSRINEYRSRGVYSAGTVKGRYSGDRSGWVVLTDEDLAAKKTLVAGDNREALPDGELSYVVESGLIERVEALLAATPVTVVLDTLRNHPEASSWVQDGQALHENDAQCIFCGQMLTDSRKHDIEKHFSDEVAKVQGELDDLLAATAEVIAAVEAVVRRIPDRGLLFEDLREGYDASAQLILDQSEQLLTWARQLANRLQVKRSNVLEVVDSSVSTPRSVDGSSLERVRAAHNLRVSQHSTLLGAAAREIEMHHLKAEESGFDEWSAKEQAAKEAQLAADARLTQIDAELASLASDIGDPTPSAEVLTREVARLLGRNELSFSAADGRYVVTRDGEPAVNLSVGERSAITLVHFLEQVARHDSSKGRPIVVIDDPVSSLDSSVFMGISTYIWAAAMRRDMCQLVLLTHNFELFKQWDVQLESLHRNGRMAAEFPASLYELRPRHVATDGRSRRRTALVKWPESDLVRKKVRSSYHHAFISVVETSRRLSEDDSLETRLDAQLLFPNVIRRILESFLAFKRPEWVGDFTASMRDAGQLLADSGYPGDADALRQQLTRFAHAYSHSQSPETDESVSPDEIGAAISSVFLFMDQIDHEHFVGLCTVVGVDPDDLLRAHGRPAEEVTEVEPESP